MIKDLILFVLYKLDAMLHYTYFKNHVLISFIQNNMKTDKSTYKQQLLDAKAQDWLNLFK